MTDTRRQPRRPRPRNPSWFMDQWAQIAQFFGGKNPEDRDAGIDRFTELSDEERDYILGFMLLGIQRGMVLLSTQLMQLLEGQAEISDDLAQVLDQVGQDFGWGADGDEYEDDEPDDEGFDADSPATTPPPPAPGEPHHIPEPPPPDDDGDEEEALKPDEILPPLPEPDGSDQ